MKKIAIITPFFNEEKTIHQYFTTLDEVFKNIEIDYEYIAIDDGSLDKTYEILTEISRNKQNLTIIKFSRNFGKEIALTAGLDFADADAVIPLDADLQDCPSVIPNMIKNWQDGYKVVLAQRSNRGDPLLKKITSNLFYQLARKIMYINIPKNVGDFRLIDREVVEQIKKIKEKNRFMRGIFSWVGYKAITIQFDRPKRSLGYSKYNYSRMIKYALDGIFSFSTFPIRMITYIGIVFSFLSFLFGCLIIINKIFYDHGVPGYASIMSVILFLGGLNFIFIGIIGEYVGRIFLEVKNRPSYITEEIIKSQDHLNKIKNNISIK
jgi:glycosyltransferase involved in cell wall biosynthesis